MMLKRFYAKRKIYSLLKWMAFKTEVGKAAESRAAIS